MRCSARRECARLRVIFAWLACEQHTPVRVIIYKKKPLKKYIWHLIDRAYCSHAPGIDGGLRSRCSYGGGAVFAAASALKIFATCVIASLLPQAVHPSLSRFGGHRGSRLAQMSEAAVLAFSLERAGCNTPHPPPTAHSHFRTAHATHACFNRTTNAAAFAVPSSAAAAVCTIAAACCAVV